MGDWPLVEGRNTGARMTRMRRAWIFYRTGCPLILTKNVNGPNVCRPILNSAVTDPPGVKDGSGPTYGVKVAPTPPGPESALISMFPRESSTTWKNGLSMEMLLVLTNVAVMKNVPAGPSGVEMVLKEVAGLDASDTKLLTISGCGPWGVGPWCASALISSALRARS